MNAVQDTGADARQAASPEAELANKCLYYMSLMREVEDRIERKLFRQGKVVGGVYVGRGQEAIPVGSALCAAADDVLLPSHRDMAVFFSCAFTSLTSSYSDFVRFVTISKGRIPRLR